MAKFVLKCPHLGSANSTATNSEKRFAVIKSMQMLKFRHSTECLQQNMSVYSTAMCMGCQPRFYTNTAGGVDHSQSSIILYRKQHIAANPSFAVALMPLVYALFGEAVEDLVDLLHCVDVASVAGPVEQLFWKLLPRARAAPSHNVNGDKGYDKGYGKYDKGGWDKGYDKGYGKYDKGGWDKGYDKGYGKDKGFGKYDKGKGFGKYDKGFDPSKGVYDGGKGMFDPSKGGMMAPGMYPPGTGAQNS